MSESVSSGFKTFLFFFGIATAVFAGGEDFKIPSRNIDCAPFVPSDLAGWKVLEAGDEFRVGGLVRSGKAKQVRRLTLLCHDVNAGEVGAEYLVGQWWWKNGK